jgi:hypothetical protein
VLKRHGLIREVKVVGFPAGADYRAKTTGPNAQWCMDVAADRLEDGRRIRILTMADVFTRECLAVEVDVSGRPDRAGRPPRQGTGL